VQPQEVPITPLGVPPDAAAVLFFGGMFDPPHRAHVEVPVMVRERAEGAMGAGGCGAWLVFVPAARSPHKAGGAVASEEDRVAMLRLAVAGVARAVVWTDEVDRTRAGGAAGAHEPSFTIDTLERARRVLGPAVPSRLVIGSDQGAAFHRWKRYRDIMAIAPPLVVLREPLGTEGALLAAMEATGAWTARELEAWAGRVVLTSPRELSSTQVREMIQRGDLAAIEKVVDSRVLGYIEERGMYGSGKS